MILFDANLNQKKIYVYSNILEREFGTFYPNKDGWLHNMMNNHAEMLENYIILDEKGKKYTMTEFLDVVEKLKIKSDFI